jgi:hypothetical protein
LHARFDGSNKMELLKDGVRATQTNGLIEPKRALEELRFLHSSSHAARLL